MKTIDSINVTNKRVLLRIDINSEIINGKIQDSPRFVEHSKTINELKRKKAKVVILAHQSRPGKKDFTSLKQHAKILNKYSNVKFVDDIIGKKAVNEIKQLKPGEALLLDNVRKLKDEFNPGNNKFVKTLSRESDFFVNDAFSICHRNQTSVVSFPKVLRSVIGRSIENELKMLDKLKLKNRNVVYILGGNKPDDIILLINNKNVLTTGTISLILLKSQGYNLGKEESMLKKDLKFVDILKKYKNVKAPIDLAVNENNRRKEILIEELPSNYLILDIGEKTVEEYKKEIENAEAVFFKGVAGYTQNKNFQYGTRELLKAISKSKAFSVIAGGSSSGAIEKFKLGKKNFGHVSLSGGALVYYLAGKKLPGLEVLR